MSTVGISSPVPDRSEPTPEVVFLQLLLAAGYISKTNLKRRVEELNAKRPSSHRRSLDDIQNEANHVFDAIGMDLIQVRDDYDNGNAYFAVVMREPLPSFLNRVVMAPTHAVQLKEILKKMFDDSRCRGITLESLPISTFPARHEIIDQLIDTNRFVYLHTEENEQEDREPRRIFIGTRFLYEIEGYLRSEFGGSTLHKCIGCDKWLLQGRLCANENCYARLHDRCYDAFFSSRGIPKGECPKCSSGL